MSKLVLVRSVACLLMAAGCRQQEERISPVVEKITESVYASGVVKSNNQYEVFSNANGIITHIPVREGDAVKKGDVLLQLADITARLTTENARIAADFGTVAANRERLQEQRVNIEQAYQKLENDSLLWERQKNLWGQQIGTRNELEQKELNYKNARNNYQAATLRLTELQRQISLQELQSQKAWQISQSVTGDYTIRSEVNGKVYSLLKKEGEMVNTQTPVAVVGASGNFLLELQVDEFDIARIQPGLKILLSMDSYKGQVFEAVITTIDPLMNQRTKTFTVKASFVKAPPQLYPHLTCEANIIIREKANSLTIPAAFLLEGDYVLLPDKEKRKVHTGMRDYRKVEILDGITTHDIILKPGL